MPISLIISLRSSTLNGFANSTYIWLRGRLTPVPCALSQTPQPAMFTHLTTWLIIVRKHCLALAIFNISCRNSVISPLRESSYFQHVIYQWRRSRDIVGGFVSFTLGKSIGTFIPIRELRWVIGSSHDRGRLNRAGLPLWGCNIERYRRLTRVEERFPMVLVVLVLARTEMLQGATLCERGKRVVQMRQMCTP